MAVASLILAGVVKKISETPQTNGKMFTSFPAVNPVLKSEHQSEWLGNTDHNICNTTRQTNVELLCPQSDAARAITNQKPPENHCMLKKLILRTHLIRATEPSCSMAPCSKNKHNLNTLGNNTSRWPRELPTFPTNRLDTLLHTRACTLDTMQITT